MYAINGTCPKDLENVYVRSCIQKTSDIYSENNQAMADYVNI